MLDNMPPLAWYILAFGVIVCLGFVAFSMVLIEQQKAETLTDACRECAGRLNACAKIVNGYPQDIVIDFNQGESFRPNPVWVGKGVTV